MKKEYKERLQLIGDQLNSLDTNDEIDIEDKYDRVVDACFALLAMCEVFVGLVPDEGGIDYVNTVTGS